MRNGFSRTEKNGQIFINGKTFEYSVLGLSKRKLSFLLPKTIESELQVKNQIFWSSSKSPNGSLIDWDMKWWKIVGDWEWRIHVDLYGMPSFIEFVILLTEKDSEFCQVDDQDIRDAKLESILDESQELPFV